MNNILKEQIVVLYGGNDERDISYQSAYNVFQACYSLGYNTSLIDTNSVDIYSILAAYQDPIVLNMVHGRWGEDGQLQSIFEKMGIRHFGSSSRSSQLTFDKILFREKVSIIARVPLGQVMTRSEYMHYQHEYPHIVKVHDSGSSVNVHYINNAESAAQLLKSWNEETPRIVEEFIGGTEGATVVFNGRFIGGLIVDYNGPIFTYENKYNKSNPHEHVKNWDSITEEARSELIAFSEKIYHECECSGFILIDFRLSANNIPYILEANSIPGMTRSSLVPYTFLQQNIDFNQLVQLMILDTREKCIPVKYLIDRTNRCVMQNTLD